MPLPRRGTKQLFWLLLPAVFVAGCRAEPTAGPVPSAPALKPPTATVPIAPPQTTGLAPTWTQLPTLDPEDARALLMELEHTNKGCMLPCWWGITPGETTWEEARQFFATFAILEPGSTGTITIAGQTYPVHSYHVAYQDAGNVRDAATFYVREGVITEVSVGMDSTAQAFGIRELLRAHGVPKEVWINTFSAAGPSSRPEGFLPFRILVLYRDRGFMAFYDFEGHISEGTVVGCPEGVAPRIYSWSQDEASLWTDERVQLVSLGPDSSELKGLEQVSSWNVDDFYAAFTSGSEGACIETPSEKWSG